MRKLSRLQTLLIGGAALIMLGVTSCNQEEKYQQPDAPILEVPFTQVHIDDSFWAPRIETNRTVSIPSAFYQCEVNGRFDNFAIAGGLKKGEHRGDFSFDDTDPYKIIEGASYALAAHYDAKLDHYLDSVITIIAAAQEPDGYLTTCVTNKCTRLSGWWGTHRWEKINSHELYNCGHLYEAAVAHFRATGKRTLLNVAIKNADLVCQVFGDGEGQIHRPGGHPIVEMALAKLYKVTGNEKYLQQARYFVEETGRCTDGHQPSEYSQDHMPILQQQEIVGHAVRAGYLYSGVADVAALTNDTAYYHALERIWQNVADCKLYITGGIGSRAQGEGFGPNYELHNHTAYCETCAAIANVYWNYRMFLASGDAKYADKIETAIFNAGLGSITKDFKTLQYFSSVNQFIATGNSNNNEFKRGSTWMAYRPTHETECCAGNVHRFMPNYVARMWLVKGQDALVSALYGASEVSMPLTDGSTVGVVEKTNYPFEDSIDYELSFSKSGKKVGGRHHLSFYFRIPSWVEGAQAYLNGKPVKYTSDDKGFAVIDREFKNSDVITVKFDVPTEVKAAPLNQGSYVQRGPVLYAYSIPTTVVEDTAEYENMHGKVPGDPDFKCWSMTPSGAWNYGMSAESEPQYFTTENEGYPFDLESVPSKVLVPVREIDWSLEQGRYTPECPTEPVKPISGTTRYLELVPYGSTCLRLTVLPALCQE